MDVGVGMIMIQMGIRADCAKEWCGKAVRVVVRKRREVPCEIRVCWLQQVAAGDCNDCNDRAKRGGIAGRKSLKRRQNRADEHVAESVSQGSQLEEEVMGDG